MTQEYIEIHGAHENNLKNISLRIPKRKVTVFTGVSMCRKDPSACDDYKAMGAEIRELLNRPVNNE